jgi:hypothetical protein
LSSHQFAGFLKPLEEQNEKEKTSFLPICRMKGVESFRDFPQTFDGLVAIRANVKTNFHLLRRFNLKKKKIT